MTMKNIYVCLMLLFFITVPAFAQDQPPSADDIVSKMQSQCNLTQDQVTAVTPIIQKYMDQRQALRQSMEDGTADKDSIHSQMKQLREAESQDLGQVLSPDQMSQCKSVLSPGGHKHGGGEGGSNGGGSWGSGNGEGGGGGNGESGNGQ